FVNFGLFFFDDTLPIVIYLLSLLVALSILATLLPVLFDPLLAELLEPLLDELFPLFPLLLFPLFDELLLLLLLLLLLIMVLPPPPGVGVGTGIGVGVTLSCLLSTEMVCDASSRLACSTKILPLVYKLSKAV